MANIKEHLKQFGATTSVKGISKVLKSKSTGVKILWMFAILAGASIATYQLSIFLVKYFSYSVYTKVSFCNDCLPPFPDVTFCNLNPVSLISSYEQSLPFNMYMYWIHNLTTGQHWDLEKLRRDMNLDEKRFKHLIYNLYSLEGYMHNIDAKQAIELVKKDNKRNLIQGCTW